MVRLPGVTQQRMTKDEFYDQASKLDEEALRKALWTLYWRGSAPMRERIEAQLDPQQEARKRKQAQQPPDPETVLAHVREFVDLAYAGAYLGRDRRVTPKERSRWRYTFRELAKDATSALLAPDVPTAALAVELLVDLASVTRGYDLFRSEDAMQAAGFVVSDAVEQLWTRTWDHGGFPAFAEDAARQLIEWESPYGWTRFGLGSVAEKETSLTKVLDGLLTVPDHWETLGVHYLQALNAAAQDDQETTTRRGVIEREARDRADRLADWHERLFDQLQHTESAGLLEQIATHPALAGAERTYLQAVLAHRRGEAERARELIDACLREMPGHEGFKEASRQFGSATPG